MTGLSEYLEKVDFRDQHFVGTIAFRNEEVTLPDGSKVALGMDDGLWVLVHQIAAHTSMKVYKYDLHQNQLVIDQKAATSEEIKIFKELVFYFIKNANVEDLVTLLPPQS